MERKKLKRYFKNKKVLITGHTGFKGSWLSLWLYHMNANVMGISSNYISSPSHFEILNLKKKIKSKKIDLRNYKKLKKQINTFQPDVIFHLAAEAIVKRSFLNPRQAWETNTMGTINILEIIKEYKKKVTVIIITSDKVYKNREINRGYHEEDILGGIDPYSASKASADLAAQSYIKNYLIKKKNIRVAIARAGNVIGGGDWAEGRLIPDCVRCWSKNKKVILRNPKSTRPWQHVLDVLRGYILLSINLIKTNKLNGQVFNFGPKIEKKRDVINVVKEMQKHWKKAKWQIKNNPAFFESKLLQLNSSKANKKLKWFCLLNIKKTIKFTTSWYKFYYRNKKNILNYSVEQIKEYENIIK